MNGFISWEKVTDNVINVTARVVGKGIKAEIQDVPIAKKHLRDIYFLRKELKLTELPVEWASIEDDDSDDDGWEWRQSKPIPKVNIDGIEVSPVSYRFEELEELVMGRIHLWGSGNINKFLQDVLYPRDSISRMNLDLVNYYHYFDQPMAGWEFGNEVWRDSEKEDTYLVGGTAQNTALYLGKIFSRELDKVDLAGLTEIIHGEVQVPTEDGVLLYFRGEEAVKLTEIASSIINEDGEYEFDFRDRIWF